MITARSEWEAMLRQELQVLLNRYSAENNSNTPDYVLAYFLLDCLTAFDKAVAARELRKLHRTMPPEKPRGET